LRERVNADLLPWSMSPRVLRLQTARAWGKTPSEFAALSHEDRVYMMALSRIEGYMRAWERQVSENEAAKIQRESRGRGRR